MNLVSPRGEPKRAAIRPMNVVVASRKLVLVVILFIGVSGCTGTRGATTVDCVKGFHNPTGDTSRCTPDTTATRSSRPTATARPAYLNTHCGIDDLTFGGRWYQRVGGVLVVQRNASQGWDQPRQQGLATTNGTLLTFRDVHGHEEHFSLRSGATAPKHYCR